MSEISETHVASPCRQEFVWPRIPNTLRKTTEMKRPSIVQSNKDKDPLQIKSKLYRPIYAPI